MSECIHLNSIVLIINADYWVLKVEWAKGLKWRRRKRYRGGNEDMVVIYGDDLK